MTFGLHLKKIAIAVLALGLIPLSGLAASPSAAPVGNYAQALKKSVDDKECGLGCLHEQAKGLLSVEEVYLANQAKKVGSSTALPKSVKSFCAPGESDADCKKNYLNLVQSRLNQNRVEIGRAQDTAAQFHVDYAKKTGQAGADSLVRIFKTEERAQEVLTAAIPSTDDLLKVATKNGLSEIRKTSDFQALGHAFPKPEDFPKFKEVLRNPDHPDHGNITVVDRNPDGTAKLDEAAYLSAVSDYRNLIQGMQGSANGLNQKRQVAGLQAASALPVPGSAPAGNASSSPTHQALANQYAVEVEVVDAYETARGQYLSAADQGMGGARISSTTTSNAQHSMEENDQKQRALLNSKMSTPVYLPDQTIQRDISFVREIQRM
ncbi:MAG: hypothetical protein JNL01_11410 [Bdellovibrionales bacterium]|nr:hypothetical protein [Bdellovibrionales bacterium]